MSGINLAHDTITRDDIENLSQWLLTNPRLTKGELTVEFENNWSAWQRCNRSLFVNSGSSANLIMAAALKYSGQLRNNRVIAPTVAWGTTIAPFLHLDFDVELCDCENKTFGMDIDHLKELIASHKPAVLIVVHVLGCPNQMAEIVQLCEDNDIILLEDCCEAHGARYNGVKVGNFGEMSSFSFYYGHHMSTIEGGMVSFRSERFYELGAMLRSHGWIRDLTQARQEELVKQHNFSSFESLYFFLVPGFNVRSTDLNAFIGIEQLKTLDEKITRRHEIWNLYSRELRGCVRVQNPTNSIVSPLAFGFISESRNNIVDALEKNNIECRPLICGGIHRHPFWQKECELPNADYLHDNGIYVPVHDKLSNADVLKVCNVIKSQL